MADTSPALSKVHPAWLELFPEEFKSAAKLLDGLSNFSPDYSDVFRVFDTSPKLVKVVIVGQDPYPTKGDATGLAFSVNRSARLPKSLQNIFKELKSDLDVTRVSGELSDWQSQGVFLINRVLTVPLGNVNGHKNIGWESFTEVIIKHLGEQGAVGLLMGAAAHNMAPYFSKCIQVAHPSPLSAYRGFFGSQPFSRINALLDEPISW